MAGIFPESGVGCANTINAACGIETTSAEDCPPLYYNMNCNTQVSPAQVNALISELANAVNLTDDYDCQRLDNLKQTLAKVFDLCNQPTKTAVDLDDFIAGCFDGENGKISVQLLRDLILSQISTLCELPIETSPVATDTLAGCFDGEDKRIPISALSGFFGSIYLQGAQFYQTPLAPNGTFNVTGRTVFAMNVFNNTTDGEPLRIGNVNFGVGTETTYLVIKKGSTWYWVNNGVANPLYTGDVIPYEKEGDVGNQRMIAYAATPF